MARISRDGCGDSPWDYHRWIARDQPVKNGLRTFSPNLRPARDILTARCKGALPKWLPKFHKWWHWYFLVFFFGTLLSLYLWGQSVPFTLWLLDVNISLAGRRFGEKFRRPFLTGWSRAIQRWWSQGLSPHRTQVMFIIKFRRHFFAASHRDGTGWVVQLSIYFVWKMLKYCWIFSRIYSLIVCWV